MSLFKEIEKSLPKIEKLLTEAKLLEFSNTPAWDLEKYNWGMGTMIRLKLLGYHRLLYKAFVKSGHTDLDEITMLLIKAFHKYIREKLA